MAERNEHFKSYKVDVMNEYIYENPAKPLPEWARALVKGRDGVVRAISDHTRATIAPSDWQPSIRGWLNLGQVERRSDYTISGYWQNSLRRIIHLSDSEYYKPWTNNPHTDSEGFLPNHRRKPMPKHLRGKLVEIRWCGGNERHVHFADKIPTSMWLDVSAYRIYRWPFSPVLSVSNSQDCRHPIFENFFADAERETRRAVEKFPQPNANMCALTEEVGELAEALMDKPWEEVYKEAIQVAAMAARVAIEGDPTITETRRKNGVQ